MTNRITALTLTIWWMKSKDYKGKRMFFNYSLIIFYSPKDQECKFLYQSNMTTAFARHSKCNEVIYDKDSLILFCIDLNMWTCNLSANLFSVSLSSCIFFPKLTTVFFPSHCIKSSYAFYDYRNYKDSWKIFQKAPNDNFTLNYTLCWCYELYWERPAPELLTGSVHFPLSVLRTESNTRRQGYLCENIC